MHACCAKTRNFQGLRGFTLIELMIAVVIVGILAVVALPSFMDSIRKSRRSEAFNALSAMQQAQERWRSNHSAYTTTLSDLGIATPTSAGYYDLSVGTSAGAGDTINTAYVASAIGKDGTSQAADAQCRRLSVRLRGGNIEYAGCGACDAFAYAPTNTCWTQ